MSIEVIMTLSPAPALGAKAPPSHFWARCLHGDQTKGNTLPCPKPFPLGQLCPILQDTHGC